MVRLSAHTREDCLYRTCCLFGRFLFTALAVAFVAGCTPPAQRPLEEPQVKLTIQKDAPAYKKSSDGGAEQVRAQEDEAVDLSKKTVVVMRGELRAPSRFEYKAIGINFTTQDVNALRWDGLSSTNLIEYRSEANSFYAFVVEPGTYRYAWNVVGNPERWGSRYSPTQLIEFTANAGEAIYVGDLKVILTDKDFYRGEDGTGFAIRWWGIVDYQFDVERDEKAAEAFYASLSLENAPPLQSRIMTINPMPNVKRYTRRQCDGLLGFGAYGRPPCIVAQDEDDWGIKPPG
ncbi:hypothetical protein [Pelagibius sp. Alg239-R121]|uniref:hypothetical protein n=1 Tax=Pelagibius sp. Alg239-R121 TaxID=2993448 RepID=UPI0024A627A9|nr:hypothetical protein [Pelagibius sp. Alg239-R121]